MKGKLNVMYVILALIVVVGGFLFLRNKKTPSPSTSPQTTKETSSMQYDFGNPQKSAHYETNTPSHGAVLAGVPINVVIDFNFDLAKPSSIKIQMKGKDYGVGEIIIDDNKLSMRRNMDPNSPDGIYTVNYNACWPDGSCHDGNFQFVIDRDLKTDFIDNTNQKEVTINMSDIAFKPQNMRVRQGTKITWVNDDSVEHYVNTDSHPAHTYYKEQNSKSLKKGETYSLTFNTAGFYPYHCSAHEDSMKGSIIVE